MKKQKIIGTGLSGLVGTRIKALLSDRYDFQDLSLDTGVDITKEEIDAQRIKNSPAEVVLHLAAKTNVDQCEKDKKQKEKGGCWKVNAAGTKNIAAAAKKTGKKVIYISTDFVFNGKNSPYEEKDQPDPINWYGFTKREGEIIVQEYNKKNVVARIAFPYRAQFVSKKDICRFFKNRLQKKEEVEAIKNWTVTPTFIDDIAEGIDALIQADAQGIYHLVGSSFHTPYDIAVKIADIFRLDKKLIKAVKLKDIFVNKAPRPQDLRLKNDKIKKLGVHMQTLEQGLKEIKKQLSNL